MMPLSAPPSSTKGLLYLSFNQDVTCISLADYKGIKIYSLDSHKICYLADVGAVSIAEMLFCTSLMAFVGAGTVRVVGSPPTATHLYSL